MRTGVVKVRSTCNKEIGSRLFWSSYVHKGEPCCFFVSRRASALVCLASPNKKQNKNGRVLSAIALSCPSPAPELVPCNMCSCCECCTAPAAPSV